ncbi:MAG: hypothetical protein SGPRY_012923 [Prymnesium sp.]
MQGGLHSREAARGGGRVSRSAAARAQMRHWQKLAEINSARPSADCRGTSAWRQGYHHLRYNLKKFRIQDERFAEIERENHILLAKIGEIMAPTRIDDPTDGTWEFRPGVRLNRFQVPVTDHGISISPKSPQFGTAMTKESLNRSARRRELERITRENRGIVERIEKQVTHYPKHRYEEHSREHDRHLSLCAKPVMGMGIGFPGQYNYLPASTVRKLR